MAIEVKYEKGFYIPIVLCDLCGKVIERDHDGTVAFVPDKNDGNFNIFTVHNGRCFAAFEKSMKHSVADIPLNAFIIYLARELKLDQKNAERVADLLSMQ